METISPVRLTNKALKRSAAEKTLFLALSNDIAKARERKDLLELMNARLKRLFYFTHSLVTIIDHTRGTYGAFMVDPNSFIRNHPGFNGLLTGAFCVEEPVIDIVLRSDEPMLFNLDELSRQSSLFPLPDYLQYNHETGIKEVVLVALKAKKGNIGFLTMFSDRENNFDENILELLKSISAQLSTAVSNILINEEIEAHYREKSILLAFNNDMASARSKTELAVTINRTLKELSLIKVFILRAINPDGLTTTSYLYDPSDDFISDPDYQPLIDAKFDIKDGLHDVLLESDHPVLINVDEIMQREIVPLYARYWKKRNIDTVLGSALRTGGKALGFIWAQPDQVNMEMFKAICSQISIALSNITSIEKITAQLEEIKKYKRQLEQENTYLQEQIHTSCNYSELIGSGEKMQEVYQLISQVAPSGSTVLILGETGTGKELIARAIHNGSPRKDKLMVKVNCAALPANLIESELFGHERGSFTGAIDRRIGKFELANNGTLFLDEVGEMPPELQVKLLRALQEREIERVGGKSPIKVNVRIIAATNRDLQKEVKQGKFRSDLFYRLNVFPITVPPLRERKEDIPVLADHFVARYSRTTGRTITGLSQKVKQDMTCYAWPGNVRELEHLIERSILMTKGNSIKEIHLPLFDSEGKTTLPDHLRVKTIDENERDHILCILRQVNGKVAGFGGAAELLGVPPSTLNSKMSKLGITKEALFKK